MERCSEKFRNSPEGRRQAARAAARLAAYQAEADSAIADLATLDWNSIEAVVNWCCRIQPCFDHGGVNHPREELVALFAEHGYLPKVNSGDAYDEEDMDNSGRYLVGQALDGIEHVGAPHPILIDFSAKWREKFGLTFVPDPYATSDDDDE